MKSKAILSFVIFVLICSFSHVFADVPQMINYQGKLTTHQEVLVDDTVSIIFTIYDDSTGGTDLWTETQSSVVVKEGVFSVLLGSMDPIPDTVFTGEVRYLGVKVGEDSEMIPRRAIVSVGYAYKSEYADTAEYARDGGGGGSFGWVDDGTVVRLETSADSIGIGTSTPLAKLDVQGTFNVGSDGAGYDVNFYADSSTGRMFWDESKMAFRAGRDPFGTCWSDANVGYYSFAIGYDACATGLASFATGYHAGASGVFSIAMGLGALATAEGSSAIGSKRTASGVYSSALASHSTAGGNFSTALGVNSSAGGEYSTTVGPFTSADGPWSIAIGHSSIARGDTSIAIGQHLNADTTNAIVLGKGIDALNCLVNNRPNSLMVGFLRTTPTLFVDSSNVGMGTTDPNTTTDINGDIAIRAGSFVAVDGNNNNIPIGQRSFVRITGPDAIFAVTGIAGGQDGKIVILYNTTATVMTIANESANSLAANRILTMISVDENIVGTGNVTLIYDATAQRWIVTAIRY